MRFAIFSDIHANLQAWEAVLEDIQSQGVDTLVCLGDVVGYGPMPGAVLESVYQHTDNFVLGNHDAVVGGRIDPATFNDHARYVIEWTAEQLGDEGAAFFAQVPLTLRGEKMLFTHGDAGRPGHFDYVVKAEDARPSFQACKDEVIFFGHTHDPCVFACASIRGIIDKLPGTDLVLEKGRRYMINPGSVGDPRKATDLRGCYCVYDDTTRRLSFRHVEFDVEAYRADLAASGLSMMPYFLRVIDAGSRRPEEEEELAMVHDHVEEVEVDESMTAQPRSLVTLGSPMANRPKLHFGFGHAHAPTPQQYHPQQQQPGHSGTAQTRQLHQMPGQPKKRNGLAILIVGVLIGLIGLVFVISQFAGSGDDEDEQGSSGTKSRSKKSGGGLLSGDGWEEPDGEGVSVRSAVSPGPILSLSSLEKKPFEKLAVKIPTGVELAKRKGGGQLLRFGSEPAHVEIEAGAMRSIRTSSVSIGVWIKVSPADHDRIILARAGDDGLPLSLTITSAKNAKPGCAVFGDGGLSVGSVRSASKNRIDDGEWHFIIGAYLKEEGKLRVYVDGEKSKESRGRGSFGRMEGPLLVGGGHEGYGAFEGEIYGVRIFDWGLRSADVKSVFQKGS